MRRLNGASGALPRSRDGAADPEARDTRFRRALGQPGRDLDPWIPVLQVVETAVTATDIHHVTVTYDDVRSNSHGVDGSVPLGTVHPQHGDGRPAGSGVVDRIISSEAVDERARPVESDDTADQSVTGIAVVIRATTRGRNHQRPVDAVAGLVGDGG
jgi:hypothetical protein